MPRTVPPLTDTRIKALKPKTTRYQVADGGGLVLEIMVSGSKVWRYRYSLHGKQQPLVTIGDYPAVSLTAARERARKYSEIVAAGSSPIAQSKKDRGADAAPTTVREFSALWFEATIADKSEEYRRGVRRALDKDILPVVGSKPLAEVTPGEVLELCDKIKARGAPKMALFTRNVLKRMYEYGVARHVATTNPAQALVARFIATQESRTRVLTPDEIGNVLRSIYASDIRRLHKLALHLLILTMVRKSELIEARKSEFDLDAAIWRIPAARMKKDKEHWVYLSAQAVAMLREIFALTEGSAFLFPTSRGGKDVPIAKSTLNTAVRALDMEVQHFVLHDFRRTASTHLHEMGQSSDAIEKALAHSIKGIKGVYNRAEYAEERRRILQLWADFVDAQISEEKKVVIGRFGNAA